MSSLIINNSPRSKKSESAVLNTISYDNDRSLILRSDITQNVIGDFIIGAKLGEGTFSKVCCGTHRITQEKVAIKILSKDKIKEPSDKLRIEKEINVQKKLHHFNINQQYCVIESKSAIYIITEYCSGGELFDYIVLKRRLSESEACRIFQQLIAGLEYLHKQKIVHRDLKPENLLFNSKHELKIADFGLSCEYSGKLKTPCGSPCYASPEMVTGKKYDGDAVDIWSAGVVLFTMVCGYLPFEEKNQTALFGKISKGIYSLPSFLSGSCKDILKSILVVDPSKRFNFDKIKDHPWFQSINTVMGKNIFFNSPGLFTQNDIIPLDEDIVRDLVNVYKYELKEVIGDVILNKHNSITTSYYLLLKKKLRRGGKSISNFSSRSEPFLEYITKSISKLSYFANNFSFIIDFYYNRLKCLFISHISKSTIEWDEHVVSTQPTECGGCNLSQELKNTSDKISLTNSGMNKKYMFPMHFTKFINKQQITNDQPNYKLDNTLKNINDSYLSTEPYCNNKPDTKQKFNTIELNQDTTPKLDIIENNSKEKEDIIERVKCRLAKKIANKTALQTSIKRHQKNIKKNILEDSLEKSKEKKKNLSSERIVKRKSLQTNSLKIENNSTSKPKSSNKTARPHFLNTSIISESRSNSPVLVDDYFEKKMLIKVKKSEEANAKMLSNQNKLAHYSQEQANIKDLEIACPKNNGNSFNVGDNNNIQTKINNSNRDHYPVVHNNTARVKKVYAKKRHLPTSLNYGWSIKKKEEKQSNYLTNLNKFVNIAPNKKATNNSQIKSSSAEAKRNHSHNNSLPKPTHKTILPLKENDKKKPNDSFLNIYCKKTLNEIRESVINVIGKQVSLIKSKNSDKLQLECKLHTKYQSYNFLLNINKIPDFKDYFLITPTLLHGNMWSFKCVFDKIKAKLIAF